MCYIILLNTQRNKMILVRINTLALLSVMIFTESLSSATKISNHTNFSSENTIALAAERLFEGSPNELIHTFIPHKYVEQFERALFDRANKNLDLIDDRGDHRNLGYKNVHWCKAPYKRDGGVYYRRMVEDDNFSDEGKSNESSHIEIIPSESNEIPDGIQKDITENINDRDLGYYKHKYRCYDAWKYGQYVGFRYKGKYYAYPPCYHYTKFKSCSKSGCKGISSYDKAFWSACYSYSESKKGHKGYSYDDHDYGYYYGHYSGSRRNLRGNNE